MYKLIETNLEVCLLICIIVLLVYTLYRNANRMLNCKHDIL